jgi:chemotaxis family two-component system sensor kinase Cph1
VKKNNCPENKKSGLRKRAERLLTKSPDVSETPKLSPDDMQQLVHELRVHQIELELQNEELRRAQVAIEQARDRYLDLYDYAPVAYFTLDTKGFITEANLTAVRLFGIDLEVFLKTPFTKLVSRDDQDIFYFHLRQVLETKSSLTREITLVKKSGEQLQAQLEIEATLDDNGEVNALRIVVTDITQRQLLEAELRKSRDELDLRVQEKTRELQFSNEGLERSNVDLQQFAYVASHDLQEPLRTVITALQMLEVENKGKLGEKSDRLIHYAVDSAGKMQALIQDLLKYSRLTSQVKALDVVDIKEVLDHSILNLKSLIDEKGTEVACDEMPLVKGDPSQLLQVFQNLISNAVKFGPAESPRVRVSALLNGNEWVFSVKDNGIGIQPDHFDRIFEIFQQLTRGAHSEGTGIGLAIVKKIVERHRGRVWVESEIGIGSTFYFTIPDGSAS